MSDTEPEVPSGTAPLNSTAATNAMAMLTPGQEGGGVSILGFHMLSPKFKQGNYRQDNFQAFG